MTDAARFWDKTADKYAKKPIKDMETYERTLDGVREYLSTGDEVLEVGCGTGTTALRLAPSVGRLTATDISARMIEIANQKAVAEGAENVRFDQGTLFDEALEPGSFDVVLGFNFLHLLEDELESAVDRAHALLKPNGLFITKTVCLGEQSRLWAIVVAVMKALGLAPPVRCLKVAELEEIITSAGFEICEASTFSASLPSRFIVARRG